MRARELVVMVATLGCATGPTWIEADTFEDVMGREGAAEFRTRLARAGLDSTLAPIFALNDQVVHRTRRGVSRDAGTPRSRRAAQAIPADR